MTTAQLPLIPERLPTLGALEEVLIESFPPDEALAGPPPSAQLVESIRRWGVLEPVLVRAVGGALDYTNPALLISGRRRIKAVRLLHQEYREKVRALSATVAEGTLLSDQTAPGYAAAYERLRDFRRIPCRVVSDPEGALSDGRTEALLVASNAVRTDNPQADFTALATLLERFAREGLSERDALAEVSRATGLATGTVKQRLRLLDLSAELQDDFLAGRLGYTVALHASRLDPESQEVLAGKLDAGGRATLETVKDAKREAVRAVQAGLFEGLPGAIEGAPPIPSGAPLTERATQMIEHLRAVRLPITQEAAGLMADLLAAVEEADARPPAGPEGALNGDGIDPAVFLPTEPTKRTRRKKVTND